MSSTDAVAASYERIARDGSEGIFIELIDRDTALAAARLVDAAIGDGALLPLAGRTVAVKGNIDVAGHRTTAGCPSYGEIAAESAPAVGALEAAGAVVIGITNLDQFATGLVGTRSPYGICPNAHWPELIAGGSSSGSAVAVARGLVDLGVGTDTAGSGRVPAAANAIVGLKPTRGWISTRGVVPACRSLDCVSVFARSVDEAAAAVEVMAGFDAPDPWSRRRPLIVERAVRRSRVGTPDLAAFLAAGRLLYDGAFVAERYDAVGAFIESHRADVDPIVAEIILAARDLPAWRLARDIDELARLRRLTEATWKELDVLVVPTVPRIPTVAEVLAEPLARNAELGTYMSFVNLLDLCALTIPVGDDSVTLIAPAWCEPLLVSAASDWRGSPAGLRTA